MRRRPHGADDGERPQGGPKEFAVVIAVPTFIERRQIEAVDKAIGDHLDAYSASRLVEHFDGSPCAPVRRDRFFLSAVAASVAAGVNKTKSLGVTIEAGYAVGEYDILILSAGQSDRLEMWLVQSGSKIPAGAAQVLKRYSKQKMRLFVARVNLGEMARLDFAHLRPLQAS